MRHYKFQGLTMHQTSQLTFTDETGATISVVQYFRDKYNINLQYPFLLVIQAGTEAKPMYLPMEVSFYYSVLKITEQNGREREFKVTIKFAAKKDLHHLRQFLSEIWENAFAMFQEMEMKGIQPDLIACVALMWVFNKGNQPAKVVVVAEYMQEKKIPMNDSIYFEMLSACSILRDWRKTIELIEMMEPSFNIMSIGLLNQLLHSIGKLGKTETMMKILYKIVATGAEISSSTYSVLLKNILPAGNWRKYLEWMGDSGVQASVEMHPSILAFAQSSGREYSVIIQDRSV